MQKRTVVSPVARRDELQALESVSMIVRTARQQLIQGPTPASAAVPRILHTLVWETGLYETRAESEFSLILWRGLPQGCFIRDSDIV
jgi:hypothetical protein